MHKLMEKTCEALKDIERSGSFNVMDTADRRLVSELVDLKKNILKTQKLEDEMEGYSEDGGMNYGGGSSYANRGQHYVRSHYSRDDGRDGDMMGYSSRRDGRGRYSREDGTEEMMKHLRAAAESAPDKYRGAAMQLMREIENA